MKIIPNSHDLKVKNLDALPRGVGSKVKYLECITGQGEDLVAKQWRVKKPNSYDILIALSGAPEYRRAT